MSGSRQKQLSKQRKLMEKGISELMVTEAAKLKQNVYDALNNLPFRHRFAMACRLLIKKM